MKKIQLLAILGLLSLTQAFGMDDPTLGGRRGKDMGTIDPAHMEGSARPAVLYGGQPVQPYVQPAAYTGDARRGKDFGTIDPSRMEGSARPAVLYGGQPVQPYAQPAPYTGDPRRGKDFGTINMDPTTPAAPYSYTAKPAAVADAPIRYNKPLPTPPVKKAAVAVVLSAANQTLVDNLVAKLTELGTKINSLNDKIPAVAGTLKGGDASKFLDPKFIKTGFWTVVRGGEAALLTNKIKGYIQTLNQADSATKQEAKTRVTPVLTSAAFTTATRNLEEQLSKLPEPIASEAKSLVDVTKFLKAQFNIGNTP
jgi:hypothetical protein